MKYLKVILFVALIGLFIHPVFGQSNDDINQFSENADKLFKDKKFEEAINELNKILEIDPDNVSALNQKGDIRLSQGKYVKALQNYEKAVDHLAYSLQPPVVAAVLDFEGGGRITCELTDVDPGQVAIGNQLEMSFRRLYTGQGVHNYFWKARPRR